MGLADALFGKKLSPEEQVKKWKGTMREQNRNLDRQVRQIEREELKLKLEIKKAAKKGDNQVVRILAKEMVQSRRAKNRIFTAKAQINSVTLQLQQQAAQVKVMGAISKSTEVMQIMNNLMKVPEIAATMREMSKEMQKAGIMEDMINDTMDGVLGDEDEDEVDSEVDNVLGEILGKELGGVSVGKGKLSTGAVRKPVEEDELPDDDLVNRLAGLKE